MAEFQIPIVKLAADKFQVAVDTSLYAKESIVAAIYKYSNRFYIHQKTDSSDRTLVDVIFESKDGSIVGPDITKQFCNELIEQQIRYNTNAQFGHIRDMIVQEAFKPVTK